MLCLDNSDWARDGDYQPTRWEAQIHAATIICEAKVEQNPENSVGILTTAGKRIEVLTAPTQDSAKIYAAIHSGRLGGDTDAFSAVKVAALALKHRQNKNQKARILLFVCSPVQDPVEKMTALGKELKKNNVAVDIISFGALESHAALEALQKAANSGDNSHYITIPPEPDVVLANVLLNTPILQGEVEVGGAAMQSAFPGGVNPEADPELAEALRLSMEEFKAQQIREEQAKLNAAAAPAAEPMDAEDSTKVVSQAVELSSKDETPMQVDPPAENSVFQDKEYVTSLLSSLPGVDMDDPKIKEMLEQMKGETPGEPKPEEKKEEEKKEDQTPK